MSVIRAVASLRRTRGSEACSTTNSILLIRTAMDFPIGKNGSPALIRDFLPRCPFCRSSYHAQPAPSFRGMRKLLGDTNSNLPKPLTTPGVNCQARSPQMTPSCRTPFRFSAPKAFSAFVFVRNSRMAEQPMKRGEQCASLVRLIRCAAQPPESADVRQKTK